MKNWKTSLAGIATILSVVCAAAISYAQTGTFDPLVLTAGIAVGWGLLVAGDSTPTVTP